MSEIKRFTGKLRQIDLGVSFYDTCRILAQVHNLSMSRGYYDSYSELVKSNLPKEKYVINNEKIYEIVDVLELRSPEDFYAKNMNDGTVNFDVCYIGRYQDLNDALKKALEKLDE